MAATCSRAPLGAARASAPCAGARAQQPHLCFPQQRLPQSGAILQPHVSQQQRQRHQRRRMAFRAEKETPATDTEKQLGGAPTSPTSSDDDVVSRSEVQKLSELRREQQRAQTQTNIVQGAIEEAQLITWPSPSKAFFDTLLVLGIVAASGSLLFGLNVLLAEASEWWYHRG